jgi:CRISPR/Cas system-associated endonuclease/helicase Cas3
MAIIKIYGETPQFANNPSKCKTFRERYPKIFSPLQSETFERVSAGDNLALIAPTSSGKTLAIAAPLFEFFKPTIFVYPFRALVLDQTNQLLRYAALFGIGSEHFAKVMGGATDKELANALEKDYVLMTPDKLIALLISRRTGKAAALTIHSKYNFVFDEIHAYNSLMKTSLIYFIRSVKYWQKDLAKKSAFYFLSATFPEDLWQILQEELEMTDKDKVEGVSYTGDVELIIKPCKETIFDKAEDIPIVKDIKELGMTNNVVGIFDTAIKAWKVAEGLWGSLAEQKMFVGQDKMSEKERVRNFDIFIKNPEKSGLCGSPAIEAGVDFNAYNLIIEETFRDSFLQRFGRAARSGQNSCVLCFSSRLYDLLGSGKLKDSYKRKEFLKLIDEIFLLKEPREIFRGLAAYNYYKFWDVPDFIKKEDLKICRKLEEKGVERFLAFRGFTPFTKYESGEYIGYESLFKKDFKLINGRVAGSPSIERYYFTPKRPPVIARVKKVAYFQKVNDSTFSLMKVDFQNFGEHWVVLEIKTPEYERLHPDEEDSNICLRLPSGEIGRTSDGRTRNGIVKFYDADV